MAGDRGFYYPKLIASANDEDKRRRSAISTKVIIPQAKPAKWRLSEATNQNYQSIFICFAMQVSELLGY
jgi:hypothetical protein